MQTSRRAADQGDPGRRGPPVGRFARLRARMARRSLRPQLNQIRAWVRQGRTDAWIAHQLEVTVQEIQAFKRDNELAPDDGEGSGTEAFHEDIDLRAEDDALIAAELDAVQAEDRDAGDAAEAESVEGDGDDQAPARGRTRRRGRRGGRSRRRAGPVTLEGSFDHGEEGYGLWLDPAVQD